MNTLVLSLVDVTGLVAMRVLIRLFTNEIKQPSCSGPKLEDDRRAGAILPIREQTYFSALARAPYSLSTRADSVLDG